MENFIKMNCFNLKKKVRVGYFFSLGPFYREQTQDCVNQNTFEKFRQNQKKLINLTTENLEAENSILISAPSGMGKTIGTLFPSIKYALKNNHRIFIATSKTTQQRIYEKTLKKMIKKKAKFNSIILTAKEKICNNIEFNCDPSICPYLENYINGTTSKSVERLLTKKVLNSRIIKREANKTMVLHYVW